MQMTTIATSGDLRLEQWANEDQTLFVLTAQNEVVIGFDDLQFLLPELLRRRLLVVRPEDLG